MNQQVKKTLEKHFCDVVNGYHLINSDPIKESTWETLNCQIFKRAGINASNDSGSHLPGKDITSDIGKLSNKTSKYINKNLFHISSYRNGTICKNETDINAIIEQIEKKTNYDYYSIIVRKPTAKDMTITYDWFMIPSHDEIITPSKYNWKEKMNKSDTRTGWETDCINGSSMKIEASLSYQLWIKIMLTDELYKKYIVASVKSNVAVMDYGSLYDRYIKETLQLNPEEVEEEKEEEEEEKEEEEKEEEKEEEEKEEEEKEEEEKEEEEKEEEEEK